MRELEKGRVVAPERSATLVRIDEGKRRELRQLEALVEDEDGLESCVRQLQTPTASRSIAGAYVPVRAAAFIFARW